MMQDNTETDSCGLRRRSVGLENPRSNLPLDIDTGFQVSEGVIRGTPSPSTTKIFTDVNAKPTCISEFRQKQQSFEIHIEDCDEEEMSAGSDEDDEASRPITPAPPVLLPNDFGNVVYKESTLQEFLQVTARDTDGLTDVSEGESENDDEDEEENVLPPDSVIKRTPS